MTQQQSFLHNPTLQAQYQQGLMDGTRYRVDGHHELLEKFMAGTPSYRLGWEASENYPRASDPDHAS